MGYTAHEVEYSSNISSVNKALLNDAQTSGGLLLSMPKAQASLLIEKLKNLGKSAYLIGNVIKQQDKKILVK